MRRRSSQDELSVGRDNPVSIEQGFQHLLLGIGGAVDEQARRVLRHRVEALRDGREVREAAGIEVRGKFGRQAVVDERGRQSNANGLGLGPLRLAAIAAIICR